MTTIDQLDSLTLALQRKWGTKALQKASACTQEDHIIPTGIAALDAALGGGIPQGHLTGLTGSPTSGMTTLALQTIANAQRHNHLAAYLDVARTFDADYALRLGMDREQLLLIRPGSTEHACRVTHALIVRQIISLIVLDMGMTPVTRRFPQHLRHLVAAVRRSDCALLLLAAEGRAFSQAHVQLAFRRRTWLTKRGAITGYKTAICIQKNLSGAAGQQIMFTVKLEGGAS